VDEKVYSIFETHTDLIKRARRGSWWNLATRFSGGERSRSDHRLPGVGGNRPIACIGAFIGTHQKASSRLPVIRGRSWIRQRRESGEVSGGGVGHIGIPQRAGPRPQSEKPLSAARSSRRASGRWH